MVSNTQQEFTSEMEKRMLIVKSYEFNEQGEEAGNVGSGKAGL